MSDNKELEDFLKDPNLLNKTVKTVQEVGVVGEDKSIKSEILICCGKLVKNKETISTNAHPEDDSGIGKDYVTEAVKKVVFYKDWIKYNSPTPTSVSYSQRTTEDKDGNKQTIGKKITADKIIYIKDASEEFINSDDCKLLLEEEKVDLPKTIKQQTVRLMWEKPIVIITTAGTTTKHQLIRRLPSIHFDDTEKQTADIIDFQLEKDCDIGNNKKNFEQIKRVKDAFYLLKNNIFVDLKNVKDEIIKRRPKYNEIIMRSLNARLLDFIKFSTALHQYQRKQSGTLTRLAEVQDVDIGYELFNYIYGSDLVDVSVLNPRQRRIHKKLRNNSQIHYTANRINSWKISEGVSIQQTYEDLKKIMQEDKEIQMDESVKPKKYGYLIHGTRESIDSFGEDDFGEL